MNSPVYIFDVDGVLNNLKVPRPDERLLRSIARFLDEGTFVAINTGRGYAWIEENIIRQVRQQVRSKEALARLFAAAELGGIGVEFTGATVRKTPSAFSLTPELIAQVKYLFEAHPTFGGSMRWYEGKESMASVCKKANISIDEAYSVKQQHLLTILRDALKDQPVKVSHSTDAIDIHAPQAGKHAGAGLIYNWLNRVSGERHHHYLCFGDSGVDYETARFFAQQNHNATFVFSGRSLDGVDLEQGIRLVRTVPRYSEGVYTYLEGL